MLPSNFSYFRNPDRQRMGHFSTGTTRIKFIFLENYIPISWGEKKNVLIKCRPGS